MEGTFPVFLNNRQVGTCTVRCMGLYYLLICTCALPREPMYRLLLKTPKECIRLGIFVPEGNQFVLRTKIPAQRFPGGRIEFAVCPRDCEEGQFVPICPGQPFPYLHKLPGCRLHRQNGQLGILLPKD